MRPDHAPHRAGRAADGGQASVFPRLGRPQTLPRTPGHVV